MKKCFIIALFIFFPHFAHAAVLNFTGFESGDCLAEIASCGSTGIVASTSRSGARSLSVNVVGSNTGHAVIAGVGQDGILTAAATFDQDRIYLSFWIRIDKFPETTRENILRFVNTSAAIKGYVDVAYTRELTIRNSSSNHVATSSRALNTAQWHHVCATVGTGATSDYEVWLDGVSVMSGTGSFNASQHGSSEIGKRANFGSNSIHYYYDDVVVRDDRCQSKFSAVKSLVPNAAGTYSDWTEGTGSSDYTQVDEIPSDGNTSRAQTSVAGNRFTVNYQSVGEAGILGSIDAIKPSGFYQEIIGTVGTQFQAITISGATVSTTTDADMGAVYGGRGQLFNADPNTSLPWTVKAVNEVESGAICVNPLTTSCRTTQLLVHVLHTPRSTPIFKLSPGKKFIIKDGKIFVR